LARIEALLARVSARHGAAHPELGEICECFDELKADLRPHLFKEEQVLFPYIEALEAHRHRAEPPPESCFGSIANPIRVMTAEHDAVGGLLKQMRRLTVDYTPPADPCPNYRALYAALEGLETDLLRHIHLENNILFPRARELAGST
jgi:regulator of cell morphogenesis and NO signaling